MEHPVLVTYATRSGSTAETAKAVAQTLRDRGVIRVLQPIHEVDSLDGYGAVVLGAALYMGRLHKDARRFLSQYRDALAKIPVALFVPGPVEKREKDWEGARQQLDKELARFPWLKPIASKIVGGVFDANGLGFPFKFIAAMRKTPVCDARDWQNIREWAVDLSEALQQGQVREVSTQPTVPATRL